MLRTGRRWVNTSTDFESRVKNICNCCKSNSEHLFGLLVLRHILSQRLLSSGLVEDYRAFRISCCRQIWGRGWWRQDPLRAGTLVYMKSYNALHSHPPSGDHILHKLCPISRQTFFMNNTITYSIHKLLLLCVSTRIIHHISHLTSLTRKFHGMAAPSWYSYPLQTSAGEVAARVRLQPMEGSKGLSALWLADIHTPITVKFTFTISSLQCSDWQFMRPFSAVKFPLNTFG
jgi:hypothetical protein